MSRRPDPLPWTDLVNSTSALLVLHRLVQHSDSTYDFPGALVELEHCLVRVVPTFLGLEVCLELQPHGVWLTTLDDLDRSRAVASLGWCPDGAPAARLTLYASRRGAFVDLAADITWSARQASAGTSSLRRAEVELDRALPPQSQNRDASRLEDLALVNRAEGVLIDQGVHPDDAPAELARRAATAGVKPVVHAAHIVGGAGKVPIGL